MAVTLYGGAATAGGEYSEDNNNDMYGGTNTRQRFPGLYVGNLTWWTTDQDVINSINSVGVNDVQEVKFFENRNNGQSKGFCVVTFGSEASLSTVMEKLPKLELYGQNPVVTPYNRQNLNLFESQTNKTRPQINSNNGPNSHAAGIMGISSISGIHANTQGLPYSGLNTYNQGSGAGGGPRVPSFHTNMRLQMRAPRPMIRAPLPMNNGPMLSVGHQMNNGSMLSVGHQINRVRFVQPQIAPVWNNPQSSSRREDGSSRIAEETSSRRERSHRSDDRERERERERSRSRERSQDRVQERNRDRIQERSRDRIQERSRDRIREGSRDRIRERSRDRVRERRDRSRERRDRSRERKDRRERRERY